MADVRGIRAGAAYVELLISNSQLVRGLNAASRKLKAFGTAITGLGVKMAAIGTAVLAPLAATTKVFSSAGDQIGKMAKRTGVSVEVLSELAFAASQSGSNLEALEAGLRRMQRSIVDAARGLATAQDALGILNLSVEDLAGLSPEQQFKLIAGRLAQIQDPTLKAAAAMELFGRSGTALLPLMADGAAGIERLQQRARELGLTLTGEDTAAAEAFTDQMDILWRVIKRGVFAIGSALAPALSTVASELTRAVVSATAWLRTNRQLIVTALKVAAAVVAGGVALAGLGYAISAVGAAMGAAATIITGVGTAIGTLGTILAALLSPIGMVITGVAALAAYVLYATGTGAQALTWLGKQFGALKESALQAYQGIADALAAGDIRLAARILWLSLKLAWDNGVAALQQVWIGFTAGFVKVAYGAFYGVLAATEQAWHAMKVAWIEGVSFLKRLWVEFAAWHARAVEAAADAMVKAWIWAREKTGAITPEQAQFERSYAQGQHQQRGQTIDTDRQAALSAAQNQRDGALQAETQRHEQELAGIGAAYQGIADAAEAERSRKAQEAEAALAQARKEWQDALTQARSKRQAAEAAPGHLEVPKIDELVSRLGGLGDLLDQKARNTIGVAGTFNPFDARGLGAGGVTDRIATATEQTAKNTRKLLEKLQDQQVEFE